MGIKSEKTFEEIVERLIALIRPESREHASEVAPPGGPRKKPAKKPPQRHPTTSSDDPTP